MSEDVSKDEIDEEVESSSDEELAPSSAEAQSELDELQVAADENRNKYLRAVADLENFKKRAIKERSELIKYSGESLARDMLDVVDQLELALHYKDSSSEEVKEYLKGIELVRKGFLDVLAKHSITPDTKAGDTFDPAKHEALSAVPSDEYPEGSIIEVHQKAYFYKDKLLRPAKVVVAKAKES